ncbi:hypothetical protein [Jeotgalibacillus haloalkalitolerans]|uniref:Sigma-70 family RNA polymerase sigma factor n=1 Tax=Jeotgalibacillus haloalkalitolerans TaxID=3104292 RepID=A0ABU5KQX0_9BACL|nr:hypothetical protein [Jeotgalibacillus sp. HH7-29]MDZ5713652.1 hypothetical protein [Jeotgalibacillus sp. HH7-29]
MDQANQQWLIEANQLLLQLGVSPEHRRTFLAQIQPEQLTDRIAVLKEALLFAQSSEHDEIEKVSPHADDQELHEAIQTLPFNQKISLSLHHYHSFTESEIEQLTSLSYKEFHEQEQSALSTLADRWQTDKSRIDQFLSLLQEAYDLQEPDPEELPEQEEIPEEPTVNKEKKKSKWPAIATGGILAAAAGAIFLLNDPIPEVPEETGAAGEAEESGEEAEPVFGEGQLTELDELIKSRKEELSEALGLSEEEVNRLNVIMNVESQLQFMRDINEGYHENPHGDNEQMLTMLIDEIEWYTVPPMDMLAAFYEQADEYYGNTELGRSDFTVNMFIDNGQNLINVYEEKLNENKELITPESRSSYLEDLPEKERELREKMKENGFTYDYDTEKAEFTVTMGGEVFEERTDFLHPAYQDFLKSMPPSENEMYQSVSNETEIDYADHAATALELEQHMETFYQLENEAADDYFQLGLPRRLSFHYSELTRILIGGSGISVSRTDPDLREEQLAAWEDILQDRTFENSYIRDIVSIQYTIGEKYEFDMPPGWTEIDFEPFYTAAGPGHESGFSRRVEVPLQDYLKDVYDTYILGGDREAIKLLHPKFIILFYFHALNQKDYDIAYSLMGGEELPDYSRFEEIVSEYEYGFGSFRDLFYRSGMQDGEDVEATFTMQMNGNEMYIDMRLEDDMFKVKYTDDRMFRNYVTEEEEDAPD